MEWTEQKDVMLAQEIHLIISENVRAKIECIAILLTTSSKESREFVVLLHDFKKLLLVPKISGTSSLILLQSYCVYIAGCTYNKLTESNQLKMFNCLFHKIL